MQMQCRGRYGAPTSLLDYSRKAAAAAIEGHRAFIEAYSKNKCAAQQAIALRQAGCILQLISPHLCRYVLSTGVVQWMLQPSWPSNIWQLFQCALCPASM
jgi:hypothetical protein